jgi:DNA (cytosine-5)-methyltransferase 1
MRYLSTFSGIGGFELGITQAYESKVFIRDGKTPTTEPKTPKQSMESATKGVLPNRDKSDTELRGDTRALSCVGYSEIDKYASQIYQAHFPNHKNYGDITKINEKELPDFDLLVGGFPCQSFSIAGKRGGFSDTRGTMFFELARIIKEKQPRLFVFENVKGLLSHDQGRTFTTIITTLDELGYDCQWQIINSKNHGVPQNRERVFIIGHLRGTSRPEVFPFGESGSINNGKAPQGNDLAYCLQAGNDKHRGSYVAMTEKRTEEAKKIRKETKDRDFSPRRGKQLEPRTDDMGNCVTSAQGKEQYLTDNSRIRRLTPTECMRLQGFPDHWCDFGLEHLTPEAYNKGYGDASKTNPIEVLSSMQKTVSTSLRERWGFTESLALLKEEILQSGMYEKSIQGEMEREPTTASRTLASKAISDCDRMWKMFINEESGYTPQEQKHVGQLFVQLRGSLSELSQQGTQKSKIVLISDTQRYKTLGNAVTVNVIKDIMIKLLPDQISN